MPPQELGVSRMTLFKKLRHTIGIGAAGFPPSEDFMSEVEGPQRLRLRVARSWPPQFGRGGLSLAARGQAEFYGSPDISWRRSGRSIISRRQPRSFASRRKTPDAPPWGQVLDPCFIAKACPRALLCLLAAVVGFYLFLRLKAARPLERLILRDAQRAGDGREKAGPRGRGRGLSWDWRPSPRHWPFWNGSSPATSFKTTTLSDVLPAILQGCRSIFQGEFPDFDPCQLMGTPNAGIVPLTRRPSFPMPSHVGGWETSTTRSMSSRRCTFWRASWRRIAAARTAGLRPALAYVLGISFVLSGYILLVGRAGFLC